jgi:hypothetical protein
VALYLARMLGRRIPREPAHEQGAVATSSDFCFRATDLEDLQSRSGAEGAALWPNDRANHPKPAPPNEPCPSPRSSSTHSSRVSQAVNPTSQPSPPPTAHCSGPTTGADVPTGYSPTTPRECLSVTAHPWSVIARDALQHSTIRTATTLKHTAAQHDATSPVLLHHNTIRDGYHGYTRTPYPIWVESSISAVQRYR